MPDATLALIDDPYRFISKRCRKFGSDLFETRLMLQRATCMTGPEAARLFYDESRFIRRGAMVGRIQKTLLGKGGVQGVGMVWRGRHEGAVPPLQLGAGRARPRQDQRDRRACGAVGRHDSRV